MQLKSWQAVLLIVFICFVLTMTEVPYVDSFTISTVSLSAGVAALSLMALAALLGARWGLVEKCFGGLDRVYRAHKWLGI